ncbi:hypothetical protein HZS_4434 [Henneguya salminicola]|nr:hypothetical protein HZS_4434 [Henneguya salminicola]
MGKIGLTVKKGIIIAMNSETEILRKELLGKMIVEVNGVSTIGFSKDSASLVPPRLLSPLYLLKFMNKCVSGMYHITDFYCIIFFLIIPAKLF